MHFKTSYVTVYLINVQEGSATVSFQNIVCYCLSLQYLHLQVLLPNFKTSYVTVYPCGKARATKRHKISKHRMLLFIIEFKVSTGQYTAFQNIVCYCLSTTNSIYLRSMLISKHRMLLFIYNLIHNINHHLRISKHRMLLFISTLST